MILNNDSDQSSIVEQKCKEKIAKKKKQKKKKIRTRIKNQNLRNLLQREQY